MGVGRKLKWIRSMLSLLAQLKTAPLALATYQHYEEHSAIIQHWLQR